MVHTHTHIHHHGDDEGHRHQVHVPAQMNRNFYIGIGLNLFIVLAEAIAGLWLHSLALLTDAGHNLGDAAGLALALIAYKMSALKPTAHFTYGFHKTTVLTSLINAVVLLVAVGFITYSVINRLQNPHTIEGGYMSLVALVAIVLNVLTARLFIHAKDHDLNMKGAYLHMLSDALVSAGVLVAGVIIYFTHWYMLDPIISIVISVMIVYSTWGLLTESLNLVLDAVPAATDIAHINTAMLNVHGVRDVHHVHVWALGTTQNALTAHVVLQSGLTNDEVEHIKHQLKHALQHENVQHATLETEFEDATCEKQEC